MAKDIMRLAVAFIMAAMVRDCYYGHDACVASARDEMFRKPSGRYNHFVDTHRLSALL